MALAAIQMLEAAEVAARTGVEHNSSHSSDEAQAERGLEESDAASAIGLELPQSPTQRPRPAPVFAEASQRLDQHEVLKQCHAVEIDKLYSQELKLRSHAR